VSGYNRFIFLDNLNIILSLFIFNTQILNMENIGYPPEINQFLIKKVSIF
jgi:hypothetical protein